jgi:hypothetical protein
LSLNLKVPLVFSSAASDLKYLSSFTNASPEPISITSNPVSLSNVSTLTPAIGVIRLLPP